MHQYKELLAGCQKEDARSQRILYDAFKSRLMGLCRRYSNNREEAKDVLQESFIKIFRNIRHLSDPEKLESWLKSIVVNTAIDHYRKKNVLKMQPIDEVVSEEVAAKDEAQVTDDILVGLVSQLPDGCRLVFNLFVVEGYSHAEISAMLEVTEGTSRSQLNYAKAVLKNKLKCHDVTQYYEKFA